MNIVREPLYCVLVKPLILSQLFQKTMHQFCIDLGQIPNAELLEVDGIWNIVRVLQIKEIDTISVHGYS